VVIKGVDFFLIWEYNNIWRRRVMTMEQELHVTEVMIILGQFYSRGYISKDQARVLEEAMSDALVLEDVADKEDLLISQIKEHILSALDTIKSRPKRIVVIDFSFNFQLMVQ